MTFEKKVNKMYFLLKIYLFDTQQKLKVQILKYKTFFFNFALVDHRERVEQLFLMYVFDVRF